MLTRVSHANKAPWIELNWIVRAGAVAMQCIRKNVLLWLSHAFQKREDHSRRCWVLISLIRVNGVNGGCCLCVNPGWDHPLTLTVYVCARAKASTWSTDLTLCFQIQPVFLLCGLKPVYFYIFSQLSITMCVQKKYEQTYIWATVCMDYACK